MPSDGEDDVLSPPGAAVLGDERMGIGEMDGAEVLDEVDAVATQLVGQMLLLEGVASHPIAVGQHCLQVGLRRRTFETEG